MSPQCLLALGALVSPPPHLLRIVTRVIRFDVDCCHNETLFVD